MSTWASDEPTKLDLVHKRGDSASISFDHTFGAVGNISEAKFTVRQSLDGTLVYQLTFTGDVAQWNFGTSDAGSITINPADTANLLAGEWFYDIELTHTSGEVRTFQEGRYWLSADLTTAVPDPGGGGGGGGDCSSCNLDDLADVVITSPTSGQVLTYNGTAWVNGAAGSGVGTVTSVGLSAPAQFSVTGSPVTSAGTLALAWQGQSANVVLAGPSSGAGTAVPAFRALVLADLPAIAFNDLSDVSITSVASGNYARYNGSAWVNVAISQVLTDLLTVDGPGSGLNADLLDGLDSTAFALVGDLANIDLNDLTDVVISSPSNGQVLTYNGTNWVNGAASGGASALDDLTDVIITSETNKDGLRYNGTNWVNGDFWVELAGDTMSGQLGITVPTTTTKALVLKTSDDNSTNKLLEVQSSASAVLASINHLGYITAPRFYLDTTYSIRAGSPGIRFYDGSTELIRLDGGNWTLFNQTVLFSDQGEIRADAPDSNATGRNLVFTIDSVGGGAAAAWVFGGYYAGSAYTDRVFGVRGDGRTIIGNNGGASWPAAMLEVQENDSATSTITDVVYVRHNTSGTPAAGYGTAVLLQGESTTTIDRDMGRVGAEWETATDASRKSILNLSCFNGSTEKKNLQVKTGEVYVPVDLNVDGALLRTYQAGVSAAGTTQGTATAITAENVEVTSATAGVNDGVILPSSQPGREIVVFNRSGATVKVYPPSGSKIEGLSTDAAQNMNTAREYIFICFSSTQWRLKT